MTHYVFVVDDRYVYKCVAGDQREAEKKAMARHPGCERARFVGKSDDPDDRGWSIYDKWCKKVEKSAPPDGGPVMIYTVGKTEVYEDYLSKDPNPQKGKGGSVWRTRDDARNYLLSTRQEKTFSIYGVEADWDKDAKPVKGSPWRALSREARLRRLGASTDPG